MSASLYLDMFSLVMGTELTGFNWVFASKDYFNCRSHWASPKNILVGRAKYTKALYKLKVLMDNNWKVPDTFGILEPLPYELEWIREKDSDLI